MSRVSFGERQGRDGPPLVIEPSSSQPLSFRTSTPTKQKNELDLHCCTYYCHIQYYNLCLYTGFKV